MSEPTMSSDGPDQHAAVLRVLMVTPRSPLEHGGVERHVMEVSRRLAQAGVHVGVLCTDPSGHPPEEHTEGDVVIRTVRAWPRQRDYHFAPGLWRAMAREEWDVVHVQSYHTLVAPIAMLRALTLGIPYVVTFHGGGHASRLRHKLRGVQRRALRPLLARASRLIALARFEIDEYGRELRLDRDRFALIPNGTDPAPADDDQMTPSTNGTLLLASIGRLERYKGHHRAIEALPKVRELRPDARLVIVGTGRYETKLRWQAMKLGVDDVVDFTSVAPGDREGMADLLRRVSLVVMLSEFETHPLTALEAAAHGRPLVVADNSGLHELADDRLGRAVALDDPPEAIARAIVDELEHPSSPPPAALPTWDDCSANLHDLYRATTRRVT
jgi:glycosyltransferase involved in cell wall biosynthesis